MIIEIVLSILFNRCASLQVDLIISISTRSTQVFSTAFVSSISSCLCFSHPPSLCFFEDPDFFIKYPFILVKSRHSFPSIFLSGDSHEDRNRASSYHSLSLLFSGGFKSSLVDHILSSFQCFLMPVHITFSHFLLFICSGVLKISRRFVSPLCIRSSSFEVVISF